MSTRSGRRIHSSFHENTARVEPESAPRSERKARGKRLKENVEDEIITTKKRQNYVTYPSEEDVTEPSEVVQDRTTKKSKRNTLKEHNAQDNIDSVTDVKVPRLTRQTRKFVQNISGDIADGTLNVNTQESELKENVKNKKKTKKNKTAKGTGDSEGLPDKSESEETKAEPTQEECNNEPVKSKKSKKQISKKNTEKPIVSQSSADSFHSALSNPPNDTQVNIEEGNTQQNNFPKENESNVDTTLEKGTTKNSKKDKLKRQSAVSISEPESSNDKGLNSTFDKTEAKTTSEEHRSVKLNGTFEKSPKTTKVLDTTFDKTAEKLNSTFDKGEPKIHITLNNIESQKWSLISSDRDTINLTFDRSVSHVSITSDEDRMENIINTSAVLIESSLDESHISKNISRHTPDTAIKKSTPEPTAMKREGTFTKKNSESDQIPLNREGTFTKESSDIEENVKTPIKTRNYSTPGSTPFHPTGTRSSLRSKSVLNVTRSLEKTERPEALNQTRQTRVMFYSPVNTPVVETQQKRKVIKSSMKGSNKRFVITEPTPSTFPSARKRSLTQSDADGGGKRARLAAQPTRARTASAAPSTAKPSSSRTRLPNFAALHQKRFAQMESLDECQRRKATRAKLLLTPAKGKPKDDKVSTEQKPTKPQTPAKTPKLPTLESLRPGFTRFGFKIQSYPNPFTVPNKTETKAKEIKPNGLAKSSVRKGIAKQKTVREREINENMIKPLTGRKEMARQTPMQERDGRNKAVAEYKSKPSTDWKEIVKQISMPEKDGKNKDVQEKSRSSIGRKEMAKQIVMRERDGRKRQSKEDKSRAERRTVIKGVRTNRRFDLQMQMRNLE